MTPSVRLVRLHLTSRQMPLALTAVLACAILLRIALHWRWNAYGALQLPLLFETGCAVAIAVSTASPFGEAERPTGRWLPFLRLGGALGLSIVAVGALAAAGAGGGPWDALRNTAGLIGIGLLCAAVLGGALAWVGPAAYMMIAVYALYAEWHGGSLHTPWIWPARPTDDLGAAICAGVVFAAGVVAVAVRGARDAVGE